MYEVTESYGEEKPEEIASSVIEIEFYSENELVKTKKVLKGEPIGKLPTIVKDSYNFEGWYTEENGGTLVTEKTIIPNNAEDVKYYASWVVNAINEGNLTVNLTVKEYVYNRNEIKPKPVVEYNGIPLTEGVDYIIVYEQDTTNVGEKTLKVIQSEKSRYKFEKEDKYSIIPKSIQELSIELNQTSYVYDGNEKRPTATINFGDYTLRPGVEYDISYSNNIDAGTATAKITGKGNYKEYSSKSFTITKADNPMTVIASQSWEPTFSTSSQTKAITGASSAEGSVSYSIKSKTNKSGTTVNYFSLSGTNLTMNASTPVSGSNYQVVITATAAGNKNFKGISKDITVTVTVSRKTENPTVTASTLTFNGGDQTLLTVSGNKGTMHYKVGSGSWSTTIPKGKDAATYTVSYYMDESENYNAMNSASNPKTVNVTISKKTESPTVTGNTVTYNAAAQSLATVSGNKGTMHYKLGTGSWGTAIPTATNPNTYTVYWYMDSTTNYNSIASKDSPNSVTAKINDLTYTITYNANGGTCSKGSEVIRYKNHPTLPNPTKTGYTFDGWYTASSGGTKITTSYEVTASKTFYAHWSVINYSLSLTTNWATNVGTIVTSFGGQSSRLGGTNAYYRASSASYSSVNILKDHTYILKAGPFAPSVVTPVSYTISVGNVIKYSGVSSAGAFQKKFVITSAENSVTPKIEITGGGTGGAVYQEEFAMNYAALYDITSILNSGYTANATGDYYTRSYNVETATFTSIFISNRK